MKIVDPLLTSFFQDHPDFNLTSFDFIAHTTKRRFKHVAQDAVRMDVSTDHHLRSYQRLLKLSSSQHVAYTLREHGFHSAHQIAAVQKDHFVAQLGAALGEELAAHVHGKALDIKHKVTHLWANLLAAQPGTAFAHTRANTVNEETLAELQALPSYQDLFGNQNYCSCEACKSIFGPAAYFVDIMRITDRYVSTPNASTIPPGYVLKDRRPDLFTLPLSCATTNDLLPYLGIVNANLTQHLAKEAKQSDVAWYLAATMYPFATPANQRLQRVRQTLTSLDLSLAALYSSTSGFKTANPDALAQACLQLSIEQADFVSTPLATTDDLKQAWGLRTEGLDTLTFLSAFSQQSGLSRQQIVALTEQGLTSAELAKGLAHQFWFNQSLAAGQSVQIHLGDTVPDTLSNLTPQTLDALNRYIRLSQWSGLSFADLGYALHGLQLTLLNAAALQVLAAAQGVVQALGVSWAQASSVWADMPTTGSSEADDTQNVFDQVWNNPTVRGDGKSYHPVYVPNPLYTDPLINWLVAESLTSDASFNVSRLRAGLQLNASDLSDLAELAFPGQTSVSLTVGNLSSLHRLAMLARTTQLSISELGTVAAWLDLDLTQPLSPEQASLLLLFNGWLQQVPLSIMQIGFYLDPSIPPDVAEVTNVSYSNMQLLWSQALSTLFSPAQLLGDTVDPERAAAIYAGILALPDAPIIDVSDAYHQWVPNAPSQQLALVPLPLLSTTLLPLSQPPLSLSEQELQQILTVLNAANLAQAEVLNSGLAGPLNSQTSTMAALGGLISSQPGAQSWIASLLIPSLEGSPTWDLTATTLLALVRLLMVSNTLVIADEVVLALTANPTPFGVDLTALFSLDNVRALQRYLDTRQQLGLNDQTYLPYLGMPKDENCIDGKQAKALSLLTGWPQSDICGVIHALNTGPSLYADTSGLSRMVVIFNLMGRGGFNSVAYQALLDSRQLALSGTDEAKHWQAWAALADSLEGAAAAYLGQAWLTVRYGIQATLLETQRNVLVPTLLWYYQSSHPEITTANQLSGYLLMDVQMGGSNQTSLVVEATGAVQMYLNRARANVEPGIKQLSIPEVWWEWLSTYRMWEANRRVFVYPENYLVPTLRSSSTSLFRALESDLLQTDITPARVTDAYRSYVQGLNSLASLQFVDAFRTTIIDNRRGEIDTFFQFARTATEPYEYYWAKQERGANWSQWTRIDVTIKSPYVTPVYAFGRLFVFWVETTVVSNTAIETPSSGGPRSQNSVVYKASIRYSFMDASGTWVSDQTLTSEQVIYAAPTDVKLSAQSGYDLFNMNSLFWQKCNVQVFSRKAPIGPNSDVRIDEKIAILYGPFLENSSNGTKINTSKVPNIDPQRNPAVMQFEIEVYRRSRIVNQAIDRGLRGEVSLREPMVINRELQRDYLFERTEFLNFADNYAAGVPPTVQPVYDYAMNRLYTRITLNVFRNNYYGDWNNTIETALLRSQVSAARLQFVGASSAAAQQIVSDLLANGYITAVDNNQYQVQPGFTDNVNFSFLLASDTSRDAEIIRQWTKHQLLIATIEQRTVEISTFEMTELNAGAAAQALIDLRAGGFLDAADYVEPSFSSRSDLSNILYGAPNHASVEFTIRSVLFLAMGDPLLLGQLSNNRCTTYVVKNQPSHFVSNVGTESYLITPNINRGPYMSEQTRAVGVGTTQSVTQESFISNDITLDESKKVFAQLTTQGFIDAQGRLMKPFRGDEDLSFLFSTEPLQSRQIKTAQVRVVLIDLPTMTLVSYYAEDDNVIITERSFFSMGISLTQSKYVFDTLRARKVISPQGYISPNYSPRDDLNDLFPQEPAQKAVILTADVALIMQSFFNNTWRRTLHDLYYQFTRLSTGAVPRLATALQVGGVDALLALPQQQAPVVPRVPFSSYAPGERVSPPALNDATQVDFDGVYGVYFWELFFFTPRLIADTLLQAGDFKSALLWLQYIFNPTQRLTELSPDEFITPDINAAQAKAAFDAMQSNGVITAENQVAHSYTSQTSLDYLFPNVTDPVLRRRMIEEIRNVLFNFQTASIVCQFWRFQPFRNHTQQSLIESLTSPVQIAVYNSDPYDPYAIAQLRIGAFEKATFCNYIDVLVAWGDSFFQRKTREYLNAANLLYVMASDLLGPRPEVVGPCSDQLPVTFQQILDRYNADPSGIPQFLIDMENLLAVRGHTLSAPLMAGGAVNDVDALFCVPQNEMLLARWDTVDDRLYKIRNSLDLDGNPLLLPLFAAPIDPMVLVRAAAASGSNGGFAPLASKPPSAQVFRFPTLIGNARAAVGDLQALGGELEQALIAQSSEAFMLLQSTHEQRLDQAQLVSYQQRSKGAQESLGALQASHAATEQRRSYYASLPTPAMIAQQTLSITFGLASRVASFAAIGFETGAAIFAIAPQVGSPFAMTYGGKQLELGLHRTSGMLNQTAAVFDTAKELTDAIGEAVRSAAEWKQQATEAENELKQIDKQIAAAQAEVASAQADVVAHQVSMNNAKAQQAFLLSKFDNPDYYSWRASRASALYYQAYQLAMQSVDAVQSSLQWTLGSTESYITSDPWDPSHRGLMAGNSLNLMLDRMEFAFSQKDILRQEVTKEIYLSQLDPMQLVRLRAEGVADIQLSEALFDFDFPSHYCRRIKTMEVSLLPLNEEGVFEEVHAVITQTNNKILRQPTKEGLQYMLTNTGNPGDAVWEDWRANQTVSLSKRARDDGAFLEYFGDGEKLQRFEGTGAVSRWQYQLPKATNQFDFSTIEDVKLTLRYSALNGGQVYQTEVKKALSGQKYAAALMLNMQATYEDDWKAFIADTGQQDSQTLAFTLSGDQFPPNTTGLVVDDVIVALTVSNGITMPASARFMALAAGAQPAQIITTTGLAGKVGYPQVPQAQITGNWTLVFDLKAMKANAALSQLLDQSGHINEDALLNVFLSVQFTAAVFK